MKIFIERGKIQSVSEYETPLSLYHSSFSILNTETSSAQVSQFSIHFKDVLVFPGLINSHDHLDFNSFPQLGNRIYNNYVEWGEDIHKKNKDVINNVLKIPKELRTQWGIYKNLVNGVTTVVNHGPELRTVETQNFASLLTIWQQSHSLHSVQLERNWKYKLNSPFIKNKPFAIHIGEGTDATSIEEINTLLKWNLFNRKLIGIHAVAMDAEQASKFKAIVWCPDSNYFLLGRTAAIDKLKHHTKVLFGTDSTVSSHWNLWEQLRLARQQPPSPPKGVQKMVTDNELFNMLTTVPADVWDIPCCGAIAKDYDADIVIARNKDTFFELNPEDILMILHKGNIVLFDEEIYPLLANQEVPLQGFYKVFINGYGKYIYGNLPLLMKEIKGYYPEAEFPVTC